MGNGPSKLFHAIVGLGLAAAGCGGETATASGDADASREADAAKEAAPRVVDAHVAVVDAGGSSQHDAASVDASPAVDAAHDAAHEAALDAARDVWIPVPVK